MPGPTTDGWELLSSEREPLRDTDGRPLMMQWNWLCSFGGDPPIEAIVGQSGYRTSF